MYCDRRLGGDPQWYVEPPPDAKMRIRENLRNCTCFLCVKSGDQIIAGGTAFFVVLTSKENQLVYWTYLVTAKHCVTKAFARYDTLYARINANEWTSELVALPKKWYCSPDEGVDIALIPMPMEMMKFRYATINLASAAADNNIRLSNIGIGNEVLVIGLFRLHQGRTKNIPIIRQGILAAMPDEPLTDKETGLDYSAYLAELQSIGGLSGSPVFVYIPKEQLLYHHQDTQYKERVRSENPAGFLFLLGVVRGHFDDVKNVWPDDKSSGDAGKLHSGIATVTPIHEVLKIVTENQELKELRAKSIKDRERQNAAVDDAAYDPDPFTKEDFENALKRASRRIQPSPPDEGKSKT